MKEPFEWQLISAIAIAGAFGAIARYYCSSLQLPFGPTSSTLIVNMTGSLLIGFLFGWGIFQTELSPLLKVAVTTGFLGSFTTFSSFSIENAEMIQRGEWAMMFYNVIIQVILGIILATIGLLIGIRCSH